MSELCTKQITIEQQAGFCECQLDEKKKKESSPDSTEVAPTCASEVNKCAWNCIQQVTFTVESNKSDYKITDFKTHPKSSIKDCNCPTFSSIKNKHAKSTKGVYSFSGTFPDGKKTFALTTGSSVELKWGETGHYICRGLSTTNNEVSTCVDLETKHASPFIICTILASIFALLFAVFVVFRRSRYRKKQRDAENEEFNETFL